MPVPVLVPLDAPLDLDRYLGRGKQPHEEDLPEDETPTSAASGGNAGGEPEWDVGAMSQLTSMGFPEIRCKKALLATGMNDAESAMNWLFAHMEDADIDDPIDFSASNPVSANAASSTAGTTAGPDTSMLEEMGFTTAQARKALRLNSNNPEIAVAWLFENPADPGDDLYAPQEAEGESSTAVNAAVIPGSSDLPAKYAIKSFISHKGPSVHSGHYVAHVKQNDGEWVFFNDEKVVKAPFTSTSTTNDAQDVGVKGLASQAYVYFFERL